MAYKLGHKYAKNLCKRTVLLQLIIKNVVTCFSGTQCITSQCGPNGGAISSPPPSVRVGDRRTNKLTDKQTERHVIA